jgi:hypothetical protein
MDTPGLTTSRFDCHGQRSIGRGSIDIVACQLPNWWQFTATYLACSRIGAVINPVMHIFRERELNFMLKHGEAKVSSSLPNRPNLHCPRSSWPCCLAQAARSACPAQWAKPRPWTCACRRACCRRKKRTAMAWSRVWCLTWNCKPPL